MFCSSNKGVVSLIGLLIALAIICMLVYVMLKNTTETVSSVSGDGSATPKSVLDKARATVKDAEKRQLEGYNQ